MHVISPVTDSNKGVIFIPDISGFTQFIKKTEISHSQHIITELLELIIRETGKEFSLSEIEGDALLFYNSDPNPDFEKLTLLCIAIFKKFHQHLMYYGRDRICQCGACSSTENLSLKFILHAGTITQYNVGGHHKLLGEDIIVAHRLLKNSIDHSEYILLSENFIKASNPNDQQIATLNSCEEKFESLEPTVFYYRPLKTFKENIVAPPPRNSIEFPTIKPGKMVDIKADSNELLLMLTEPEHRIKWMKSLNNITLRDHKINRILSVHECLIGSNQIEVSIEEVTTNDLGINFFERARMKHPQLDFLVLYHLEKKNNKITSLGIGNHFYKTRYWPINLFLIPVFSLMFRLFNYINLKRLKKYAEKELL